MQKIFKLFSIIVLLCCFSSCAVMFNGSTQMVNIYSQTSGGKIYTDGVLVGTGERVSVKLQRRDDHIIEVKKEGCKTRTVPLDKEFQAGWIALYVFVNPFAIITDAQTGAWYGFDKGIVIVPECECEK